MRAEFTKFARLTRGAGFQPPTPAAEAAAERPGRGGRSAAPPSYRVDRNHRPFVKRTADPQREKINTFFQPGAGLSCAGPRQVPSRLGELELSNRMVLSPMTHSGTIDRNVPNPIAATYYAKRASAGASLSPTSPRLGRRA
jgi:hypothetical protein